jgi:hypothetical protein
MCYWLQTKCPVSYVSIKCAFSLCNVPLINMAEQLEHELLTVCKLILMEQRLCMKPKKKKSSIPHFQIMHFKLVGHSVNACGPQTQTVMCP